MATLTRELRRSLENTVREARRVAEAGSRKALEQLAVQHHEPWPSLTPAQRQLRNRLRAHGRQLGDRHDDRRAVQAIDHITTECAYEHWHRMLFARFLAETDLLIEPQSGVAISLAECEELARGAGRYWLEVAAEYAQRMLPQIFRTGDPVLEVALPPETRLRLEELMEALPGDVFLAEDSLGWVYQYWQADRKEDVNSSEKKIGADELPAVTQLFTEDYMVLFLLHNTLGAWWAGKLLAANPALARSAASEGELRAACAVRDVDWSYLRFVRDGEGPWRPAAGTFESWPQSAKDITLLDPCMGSGHFLVFALRMLAAIRTSEESLAPDAAIEAVLRDNLSGLEIDPRCTQIAAFNLALAAWRSVGYRELPSLSLACSGLAPNVSEEQWRSIANGRRNLAIALNWLFPLFHNAPILGSLIDPIRSDAAKVTDVEELHQVLSQVVDTDARNDRELGVRAYGVAEAARLLSGHFTLVATNVPYLGRAKQGEALLKYCAQFHARAKADLATCFVERCLGFAHRGGTVALVTPQNWFFLGTYRRLREALLSTAEWNAAIQLGPAAFRDMNFWAANTAMCVLTNEQPEKESMFFGINVSGPRDPEEKATLIKIEEVKTFSQEDQTRNPDSRIVLNEIEAAPLLSSIASYGKGSTTGDSPHYLREFWELPRLYKSHVPWLDSPDSEEVWSGRHLILTRSVSDEELKNENGCRIHGQTVWGRKGVAINKMNQLRAFAYAGEVFDDNLAVIAPACDGDLPAIFSYVKSQEYRINVRAIDQKVQVTAATLTKVPCAIDRWRELAKRELSGGLDTPSTNDPSQWLFSGYPAGSSRPLQVGVARLAGYGWPRQCGSDFFGCPALGEDGLEGFADRDGIVTLSPIKGEQGAAARLIQLLAAAFGSEWSAATLDGLLAEVGFVGKSLDDWLRDAFFEQHCMLFRQRPFILHVWDGRRDGFHALVNWHRLAAPNGEGRRTLEKLVYSYVGDWLDRQRAEQRAGVEGADARVAAAEHLKAQLTSVLAGDPPYDIFVRWKPLHVQPIGWEPDFSDGVRMNIRPFVNAKPLGARGKGACILRVTPKIKWERDRGREQQRPREEFPWFWGWDEKTPDFEGGKIFDGNRWNDLHYSRSFKEAARARSKP